MEFIVTLIGLLSRTGTQLFYLPLYLVNRPVIMAACCADAIAADIGCAAPLKMLFLKQFLVGKAFDERQHFLMALQQHLLGILISCGLMLLPELHVHKDCQTTFKC